MCPLHISSMTLNTWRLIRWLSGPLIFGSIGNMLLQLLHSGDTPLLFMILEKYNYNFTFVRNMPLRTHLIDL